MKGLEKVRDEPLAFVQEVSCGGPLAKGMDPEIEEFGTLKNRVTHFARARIKGECPERCRACDVVCHDGE